MKYKTGAVLLKQSKSGDFMHFSEFLSPEISAGLQLIGLGFYTHNEPDVILAQWSPSKGSFALHEGGLDDQPHQKLALS